MQSIGTISDCKKNSELFMQFRADCEHINEVVKPFDWTFTTEYKGTLFGKDESQLKVWYFLTE